MKYRFVVLMAVAVAFVIHLALLAANPLRRSEASIESTLLKATPLGSSTSEVIHLLEKKGFSARVVPSGVYKQKSGTPAEVVGVNSIQILLGEYHAPFITSVSAFFAFDVGGRLIDVWIWKTVDAP